MKKLLLLLMLGIAFVSAEAQECNGFTTTTNLYTENDDLDAGVKSELGENYRVVDWNELKNISDIDAWISCMGWEENISFGLLRNGMQHYSGSRQYFLRYAPSGSVSSSFLVHDRIGTYLFLGSWTGNRRTLAIREDAGSDSGASSDCSSFVETSESYLESVDLAASVINELGEDYRVVDWNELKEILDINAWIECMGWEENISFGLLRNGMQHYSGSRQYFLRYAPSGSVASSFLVHDRIGTYLFLGSWSGNRKALAKYIGTGGGEEKVVEIEAASDFFHGQDVYMNSKAYFYCNVEQNESLEALKDGVNFHLESGSVNIPASLEYLGNGILQLELNFTSEPELYSYVIDLPEQVEASSNTTIKFLSSPAVSSFNLKVPEVEQRTDFFAGASLGAKLIAGGVAAGPSAAAASVSAEGKAGMGMTFTHHKNGDEFISRRFELGVGLKAKAPSVSAGIGEIDLGLEAKQEITGILRQNMVFPSSLDEELRMKAKAFTVLETFSMGGIEMGPFASLYIAALKKSLLKFNPDLQAIYNDLYYSTEIGGSSTSSASLGFSMDLLGDDCSFSLGEGSVSTIVGMGIEFNQLNKQRTFNLSLAGEFDAGLLALKGLVETDPLLEGNVGAMILIDADFVKKEGFENFGINFEFTADGSYALDDYATWHKLRYELPYSVIQSNLSQDNLVGFVAPFVYPSYAGKRISLEPGKISEYLGYYLNDASIEINDMSNYASLSRYSASRRGESAELKLDLSLALGIGGGIKLGMEYAFMDELVYPISQSIVTETKILPLHKYEALDHTDRLFTVTDEMYDLLYGTALLIEDPLKELQQKVSNVVEAGKSFVLNGFENTIRVGGAIADAGTFVFRRIESELSRTQKSAFNGYELINIYTSEKVQSLSPKAKSADEESTLYIISDHYNVSLIDNSENVVTEFAPLDITLASNPAIISEIGFSKAELEMAKLYFYDFESLTWVEIEGDQNPALDSVSTVISRSGTYSIGIHYASTFDTEPVTIVGYYPSNLATVQPNDTIWVVLEDNVVGSGIDFSKTAVVIDGEEVSVQWHPATNMLKYISEEPLEEGEHSFAVNAFDLNGNYSNVFSVFSVNATGIDYSHVMNDSQVLSLYPNPTVGEASITLFNPGESKYGELQVYNSSGILLGHIFKGMLNSGSSTFTFNPTSLGSAVSDGIFFIKYIDAEDQFVKKLIVF